MQTSCPSQSIILSHLFIKTAEDDIRLECSLINMYDYVPLSPLLLIQSDARYEGPQDAVLRV